ncbi:MAG TPA: serine/threonine-protein kinase [Kofleriaceae bacterium]|nr:serine/threonine-protein kinase [Kofleriaceae bacterium]
MTVDPSAVDPSAVTAAGEAAAPAGNGELVPGATVGKYRLDRVLGAGGMGVVWAAFDPDLERAVAIKVLRSVDSVASLRTRLLREARAMARLKHPNVLTVYEVGTDRNRDYIAMELIDGGDLVAWLAARPAADDVFAALLAAGRGLAAAHDAGLIHRDLKPHNILRGKDGGVYVTDFGLARGQIDDGVELMHAPVAVAAASGPRAIDSVLDSPLTQTGMLIGTPAYMAPEQFIGRSPDPRSDQFAFCVTAWEALTGARPFAGRNLDELRAAAVAGVRAGVATMPAAVRGVLTRGLAPDPAARWPDMHTLLRELDAALVPRPPRRSTWRRVLTVVPPIVAAIAAVVLWGRLRAGAPRDDDEAVLAGGKCPPASQAFGDAARLDAADKPAFIAVTAMIEGLREEWTEVYDEACANHDAAERRAHLHCLYSVRDDLRRYTHGAADRDAERGITALIPMNIRLSSCKR